MSPRCTIGISNTEWSLWLAVIADTSPGSQSVCCLAPELSGSFCAISDTLLAVLCFNLCFELHSHFCVCLLHNSHTIRWFLYIWHANYVFFDRKLGMCFCHASPPSKGDADWSLGTGCFR